MGSWGNVLVLHALLVLLAYFRAICVFIRGLVIPVVYFVQCFEFSNLGDCSGIVTHSSYGKQTPFVVSKKVQRFFHISPTDRTFYASSSFGTSVLPYMGSNQQNHSPKRVIE